MKSKLIFIEDFITNYNYEEILENYLIIFDEQITFLVENLIINCLIRPFKINLIKNYLKNYY